MLKYYYDLMSQPSRALYIFLKKTGIPFVEQPIALRKGEHLTPEFAKINPFQLVPVIDDGGFTLNESVAIVEYLADKYAVAQHWYPSNAHLRAKVNAFANWQHLNLRLGGAGVFQTLALKPILSGKPPKLETVNLYRGILSKSLNHLEQIFLKDTPFIYAQEISIADLLAICEIMQPMSIGEVAVTSSSHPRLVKWMERVQEVIGQPLFDESHKFIRNLGQKYKDGIKHQSNL